MLKFPNRQVTSETAGDPPAPKTIQKHNLQDGGARFERRVGDGTPYSLSQTAVHEVLLVPRDHNPVGFPFHLIQPGIRSNNKIVLTCGDYKATVTGRHLLRVYRALQEYRLEVVEAARFDNRAEHEVFIDNIEITKTEPKS